MTTASTQLRVLEGEIERLLEDTAASYTVGNWDQLTLMWLKSDDGKKDRELIINCKATIQGLLTIAKELEKRTEFLDSLCKAKSRKVERVTAGRETLRIENASLKDSLEATENERDTLKRRLDEAMKDPLIGMDGLTP